MPNHTNLNSANLHMEDLIVSLEEFKLLRKHKLNLEANFNIKINLPVVQVYDGSSNDVFCVNICGKKECINKVTNFLEKKLSEVLAHRHSQCVMSDNVAVITLSDSDSDAAVLVETQNTTRKKKRKRQYLATKSECQEVVDLTPVNIANESMCEVSSTTEADTHNRTIVIDDSLIDVTEIPSTSTKEALEFIPLTTRDKKRKTKNSNPRTSDQNDSVVILSEDEDTKMHKKMRKLRPIVIDGSNVAREHGKRTTTFSSKGILLSVEYFLKRGHTQVTAFVPNYRRHYTFGPIPTTDETILEQLAMKQHVVFTPSRRVNGKRVTCYDDRFIVELASKTGGVILSNDNYKDLLDVSDEFKKTIEERLLMFCFVEDILMIPNDPLGRTGPNIEEFLSMPENVENSKASASSSALASSSASASSSAVSQSQSRAKRGLKIPNSSK